jgi:hypothetical protein
MNIFLLSWDTKKCAQYHFDRHVVKMILELAQMLCTAWHILDPDSLSNDCYKPTHVNHPMTRWVREFKNNYTFTAQLALDLCDEYYYRYGQYKSPPIQHKSRTIIEYLSENIPPSIPTRSARYIRILGDVLLTKPPQAMPDECKHANVIQAYRLYYQSEHKKHLRAWKNRDNPYWFDT